MKKIFVTGGIGSGKSTLIKFLADHGAAVLEADKVGHENLENPEMKAELAAAFGQDILDEQGNVIRGALAAKAFVTKETTALLDSITQPRLYKRCLEHIEELGKTHEIVVLEMAILDGRDDFGDNADLVLAVTTSPETRIDRLVGRGLTREDAQNRLASQVPEEQRLAIADVVFNNDGSMDEFKQQIDAWWESYK